MAIGVEQLASAAASIDPRLAVLLASVVPGFEPRYAYILGVALGLSRLESAITSILGVFILTATMLVVVGILDGLLVSACKRYSKPWGSFACLYVRVRESSGGRARRYVERYGWLGLIVFVAIPLPATGIYSGALAAALLGIRGVRLAAGLALGGISSLAIVAILEGGAGYVGW